MRKIDPESYWRADAIVPTLRGVTRENSYVYVHLNGKALRPGADYTFLEDGRIDLKVETSESDEIVIHNRPHSVPDLEHREE
jgi:hypothetical protein